MRTALKASFLLLVALSVPCVSQGQPADRFDVGVRANIVGASGKPANDILGAGLYGRYRLNERWRLGFALDHSAKFDVERPYEFLGLVGDPAAGEIDADGTMTNILVGIERVYGRPASRFAWFWSAGGGVGLVDVDVITGPVADGGSYDIVQDVGTEFLAVGAGGLRIGFARRWSFELALRLEQHVTDWTVTDRMSGRVVSLDDYLVRGVHLGIARRF